MPLVLRVDVDKPYGRENIIQKVLSKIREDYWFPPLVSLGYLSHVKKFLKFLESENIHAHIYFRRCTLPPKEWLGTSILSQHSIGHHAEDTRSFEALASEYEIIQKYMRPIKIASFNKHGSGNLKLGRYHYPLYEPDQYREWGQELGVPFLFGNEELVSRSIPYPEYIGYYPNMYWIDRTYNESEQLNLEEIVKLATDRNIIVIIHPANYIADKQVERRMKELVSIARKYKVQWGTIEVN
ncbi:hypothetical protein C4544_04225 [candidate division WS5 bacterium]|uniref:NodB homology domain-containing protein n=1 Tax=candidate division WS5 bacterium TaxID=2093353 RepID=A0A419DCL6_9BACT|nr:MAG: hypothetical protein C4544_04225 [candidate division WS5 bacterium]